MLFQDVAKINEGKQPLYQEDTNKRILNSLDLLNSLDEDAAAASRLHHPQAEMIEQEWVPLITSHCITLHYIILHYTTIPMTEQE